jgi:small-conductance mechanosensitive channel
MNAIDEMLGWNLFTIGATQTTLGSLLGVVAVVLATMLLARLVGKSATRFFERLATKDDKAANAYGIVVKLLVWVIGFEIALHLLGIRLTAVLAAGGIFALGAGLAAKDVVENFLSGIMIRVERAVQPGDLIIVDGRWLIIKHIGARTIKANTYDGQEILIPNSMVAQSMISNLTRGNRLHRIQVNVGVAYESDLELVRKTLESMTDKLKWRSTAMKPEVFLETFGGSSVNYSVDVWIDDANDSRNRSSDLHEAVWRSLKEAGIVIAFPQLDLHVVPDAAESKDTAKP